MESKRFVAAAFALGVLTSASAHGAGITPIGGRLPAIADGGDLLFVVGGDNRPTGRNAPLPIVTRSIFSEIGLIHPDFVLWTGDVVYGYGDSPAELSREYGRFESLASAAGVALFDAPGNHEIGHRSGERCDDHGSERAFEQRFGALRGSFDAGGAHFIAFDSEAVCHEDEILPEQRAWLEADLEAHRNARAIFVFLHTEFFSSPTIDPGPGKDHPPIVDRDGLIALLRRYPVRAVFSGHEHLYGHESHDGIEYFVAGGGGAPLYAAPERGGFAHYVVVRLTGDKLAWDVVEPGHLFVGSGADLAGVRRTWIVNGNDADIPVRTALVPAPAALGPCARLAVDGSVLHSDGTSAAVPVSVAGCRGSGPRRQAQIAMTAPRGSSVVVKARRGP